MSVISRAICDRTLGEHGIIIVNKLDLAAMFQLMHDLALPCPDLFATPISRAVTLCTGCRWDLKHVHLAFLHQRDLDLINLIPNV